MAVTPTVWRVVGSRRYRQGTPLPRAAVGQVWERLSSPLLFFDMDGTPPRIIVETPVIPLAMGKISGF